MQEMEINLAGNRRHSEIEAIIEAACKTQDLHLRSRNSMQKYAGCVHWHYQRMKTAGTLEITYWPAQNRCWFPLRKGRAQAWVTETAKQLKVEIERQVRAK
jgi:hypothetical protein